MIGSAEVRRASLLRNLIAVGIPLIGLCTLTPNPELTVLAILGLLGIIGLLWRTSEPPVLLFVCFMQWLQGSMKLLHADLLGEPLWTRSEAHGIEDATRLTILWAVITACGAALGLRWRKRQQPQDSWLDTVSNKQLLRLYFGWSAAIALLAPFAVGGMHQVVGAANDLRWSVVFALFWNVFASGKGYGLIWLVCLIELPIGFLSFFSAFKTPIYLLALALPGGSLRLTARQVMGGLLVGATAIYLGILWSAIKMEYRDTISGGTMAQMVSVSREKQVAELLRLFGTVDSAALKVGLEALVERIAYVDYFAEAHDFVPSAKPHEGGKLWGRALLHVVTPRLLFPNKAALESDTLVVMRYTGVEMEYTDETSVALGTPAETYVDFGPIWMFLPALLLGILDAVIYRQAVIAAPKSPLAYGFGVALLLPLAGIEPSPSKYLGGLLSRAIIAAFLWRIVVPFGVRLARSRVRRFREG